MLASSLAPDFKEGVRAFLEKRSRFYSMIMSVDALTSKRR